MEQASADDISSASDAKSRFATSIKLDMVSSTQTLEKLRRPDQVHLVHVYRTTVERVVEPHDATIQWSGDGALIVFGYPRVDIDAAKAAVQAGMQLIKAVQSIRAVPKVHVDLTVGIASGEVSVDGRTGAFTGLSINLAERVREKAAPGQLLIADDTRRLVRGYFEYEDLGSIELKDFGATHTWRVVSETSVASRFAAQRLAGSTDAIVGRDPVLAQLGEAWSSSLGGRGSAVCLVGDAGMGKSRLAHAVLERAQSDGAMVIEIDCTPSTGNSPLLPIGVLLRRLANIDASASEALKEDAAIRLLTPLLTNSDPRRAMEYLAPLFGIQSAPIPLDKTREQVRSATIATIVEMTRGLSQRGPLVFLVEDLHWADDSTAQVVQSVAQLLDGVRILIVATRWPKAVTLIDLESVTAGWMSISIDPLPRSTAAELVRSVAGDGLTSARIDGIVTRCGGVPLLLEEVTRSALEQSVPTAAARAWPSDSTVPPELQLIVESRLERWPKLKPIIEAASVLGREFPVAVLEAMVPGRSADLAEALSVFADHGLLAQPPVEGGRASFKHALIRDAVYETLVSKQYLRRLHSRAADTLLSAYGGTPDASPDLVAQHLCMAERLKEAIRVRLAAAEDTFARGAYVEAGGHCDAAQSLIDEVSDDPDVRVDVFRSSVLRGMVATGTRGYSADAAEVAYLAAQSMFDEGTSAEQRYPVVRGLATSSLVRGELATAYRYSLEGLELAERSNRPDYRIDAMSVLAYTTLYFARLEDCRSWIDRCLVLYDAERGESFRYPVPQDAKTAALALLPTAAWLLGDPCGAEDAIARGLAHVEVLGRDFDRALLHAWISGTRYTQRRYLEAHHHACIAYGIGKGQKFEEWEGVGAMMALLSQSALQPSPQEVQQALGTAEMFKARGIGLNRSYFLWGIARGWLVAGNPGEADRMLDAALEAARASHETRMNPEIWVLKAEIEHDVPSAVRLLQSSYQLSTTQGAVANALRASALLVVRTARDPSEVARAQTTIDMLDGRTAVATDRPLWMHEALAHAARVAGTSSTDCQTV